MKRFITASLIVFALITAVALGVYTTQNPKPIIQNQAAVQNGTANFHLTPTTSNLVAGSSNIAIDVFLPNGVNVDGFQVMASLTGTVPSDLTFTPQVPDGMQMVLNELTKTSGSAVLKLAFITQSPQSPYYRDSTYLGRFYFTAPASGQMTLSFDNTFTKIVKNGNSEDIAAIPTGAVYTFGTASTTPSPTGSANPAATTTPTPTATPTSAPTSACNRGVQSVTLTPSSQSANRGQGLTYTVKVKNNDNSSCDKANFSLSAILPYSNWSANFAQSVLSIAPGSEGSTTVNFTSSTNSPYGTLPVGVNAVGPKAGVVAAANYQVLQGTASPKATPEVITLRGGASPQASSSATPIASLEPITGEVLDEPKPEGVLSQIPTAAIYALGGVLLIVLFFILRSLFGGDKNNPPKMTPPTGTGTTSDVPPATPTTSTSTTQPGTEPSTPQISHSVEAPMN